MKFKNYILVSAVITITLTACKKSRSPENEPKTPDSPVEQASIVIENKEYAIVKIGQQSWTATNYAGNGGVTYNNNNWHPEYGKYYTIDEAKQIVLPDRWRPPTVQDYITLSESQGVIFNVNQDNTSALKKLTSKTLWNNVSGSNASGFNAFPAGYIFQNQLPEGGDIAEFWTIDGRTYSIQENGNKSGLRVTLYVTNGTGYRFPIRFVKNN